MNKNTLLLITSDKMILKINYLKNHIHAKSHCLGGRTRTCDLWLMKPTSYQLLHPDIMLKKYHLLSQVSGITITEF